MLVTTVPLLVVLVFMLPWIASFFYRRHRRDRVFDACVNCIMWITYLSYPLLCFMTIQGFKCVRVENMHLLAADMKEPCPWNKDERKSWIFIWSAASVVLYPVGIPIVLLVCLYRLQVPQLSRYGRGEAIFQQMINLYIKKRDASVCSRLATYVGGQNKDMLTQADVAERAHQLFRDVSANGEHAVTSSRFLDCLIGHVTDEDREEMTHMFALFDSDGNGALDEREMLEVGREKGRERGRREGQRERGRGRQRARARALSAITTLLSSLILCGPL